MRIPVRSTPLVLAPQPPCAVLRGESATRHGVLDSDGFLAYGHSSGVDVPRWDCGYARKGKLDVPPRYSALALVETLRASTSRKTGATIFSRVRCWRTFAPGCARARWVDSYCQGGAAGATGELLWLAGELEEAFIDSVGSGRAPLLDVIALRRSVFRHRLVERDGRD